MKILAIDDEYISLQGLIRNIQKAAPGAEVVGFQSPEAAIRFLEEEQPNVIFTDVRMRGTDGLTFARMAKARFEQIDIIFTTGYDEYMKDAFDLFASGYLIKPITVEKVQSAMRNLRYYRMEPERKLEVRCFGDFEVFFQGKPVSFKLRRTKELFAYLIDRRGTVCSLQQAAGVLFEDENHEAYAYKLRTDLIKTLEGIGCGNVLTRQYGHLGVLTDQLKCDYYQYLEHPENGGFRGEYMSQYSWGEYTLGALLEYAV